VSGAFEGKVALVTGAAGGMGRATAQAFAAAGAQVVAADIAADGGEETVDEIKRDGGQAVFVRTDVSSARDVEAAVQTAVRTYGGLDCACNGAAIET
jgi:NAD(P)-dependent dehydrogenase (short-subunit alcohol dehydrogenase family)